MDISARVNLNNGNANSDSQAGGTSVHTFTQETKQIMFYQLNLQKSIAAMGGLADCLVKWSNTPFLMCLQEPYCPRGRIVGLPRGTLLFSSDDHPRAAIVATPDIYVRGNSDN